MALRMKILIIAMISLMLLVGCGKKDDKVEAPSQPAMASGTTDANGHVNIDVGNFTVNVDVRNAAQAVLPNITVNTYLLHNNIVVIARDLSIGYLPTVAVSGWEGSGKQETPDYIQSPIYITGTSVQCAIVMQPVQQGYFNYITDPANLDVITSDEWTTETSRFGPLSDLYNLVNTSSSYDQGVYFRLAPAVQQILGSPARTAAFLLGESTDFPTFATNCGLALGLSDNDSLYYSQIMYNSQNVPMISIDNIRMHRNYWVQFRLTWGVDPSDLDSHLWTPLFSQNPDSGASHICYYRRGVMLKRFWA